MIHLDKFIRDIPNFPKEGIRFKDITPLLKDPRAVKEALTQLLELLGNHTIDKVVGIESRGFFFGMLIAQELGAGFVPMRKPGKLPYTTFSEKYELEYGFDALEIHEDAIANGERVLLHDDVLATGGTAKVACNLIEKLGGEIVQCNFLMELSFLNGIEKLQGYEVKSVLKY
ncbi:adenine phosphoribosyltransferase [Gillisia sp. M10.2A]|uniref:Adenine phosphoribosyltransferase n=1 Tax=Gillisia lutea TaxID=2909668 RepID=A0ABS9EGQ3_9FLAO|nr:adenine phosphoribosyltransferase [Gillisia lutea]MCF4102041.1 adenine phosphoribosyltransferase [Gillisia lutea]